MEGIINWLITVQLALGPCAFGSEVIRCCSTPSQVIDLAIAQVTTLTDHEAGETIAITEVPAVEDSLAVEIYGQICGVLFAPTFILDQLSPAMSQAIEVVLDDYTRLVDLPPQYIIETAD
jgi:hypothetical protein